ncbi:hypothetical protein H6G64_28300 [Calothrix sp. FACHB-156]|nr:hypothetical protein [Calothrix sp. FACHB-156]
MSDDKPCGYAFWGVAGGESAMSDDKPCGYAFLGLMGKLHQYIMGRGTASTDFR